jgi:hypothetical protein
MILSREHKIQILFIFLGILEGYMILELAKFIDSVQWSFESFLTLLYYLLAIVVTFFNGYAAYNEYRFYPELHDLKDEVTDACIVVANCVTMIGFSLSGHDFIKAIGWLAMYTASVAAFVAYTIKEGLVVYFKEPKESLEMFPMLEVLADAVLCRASKEDITHWNEYRYWLMLDGGLAVIFGLIYLTFKACPSVNSVVWIPRVIVVLACFYLTILNRWRYSVVRAKAKAGARPEEKTP